MIPARFPRWRPAWRGGVATFAAAAWMVAVDNLRFWDIATAAAPAGPLARARVLLGFAAVLTALALVVLLPLAFGRLRKPWLAVVLLLGAIAGYFTHDYGAVVDRFALQSVFETDAREALEWLSARAFGSLALAWLLPVALLAWLRIERRPWRAELLGWCKLLGLAVLLFAGGVLVAGREIAATVRNHRGLVYVMNPASLVAASLSYAHARGESAAGPLQPLGRDARRTGAMAPGKRPLVLVLVIGESARAQSFQLGGYARPTNPELAARPVAYFPDVRSCGTNTAVSLPCMFSGLGREGYEEGSVMRRENLLDVLAHAGFRIDWYDNNTGSKRIAIRAHEESFADSRDPRFCTEACVDGILVDRLQRELQATQADRAIVLHTVGSHGPAYYLRYPPAFERFRPACRSNRLSGCSRDEVRNAYDDTILYTDHVVASAIDALAADPGFDTALVYVSDHGESTGEKGLYLHGAPYLLAPDEQTRVPMLLWMSDGFRARRGIDPACVDRQRRLPASHDNLFDLVLGLAGVETEAYRERLDPLAPCMPRADATADAAPADRAGALQ